MKSKKKRTKKTPQHSPISRILNAMVGNQPGDRDDSTRIKIQGSSVKKIIHHKVAITLEHVVDDQMTPYPFNQSEIVLGRSQGDLTLDDPDISKRHAMIEVFSPNQIFIKDLESTNGTFVNGKKVQYAQLRHGDCIEIGSSELRLRLAREAD